MQIAPYSIYSVINNLLLKTYFIANKTYLNAKRLTDKDTKLNHKLKLIPLKMTDKDPPPAYPSVVLANIAEIGFKNEITNSERESPTIEQDIPPIQRIYPGLVAFHFFS